MDRQAWSRCPRVRHPMLALCPPSLCLRPSIRIASCLECSFSSANPFSHLSRLEQCAMVPPTPSIRFSDRGLWEFGGHEAMAGVAPLPASPHAMITRETRETRETQGTRKLAKDAGQPPLIKDSFLLTKDPLWKEAPSPLLGRPRVWLPYIYD